MSKRYIIYLGLICSLMWWGSACSTAGGNSTGHEFMPDMVHNTGYEANLYDYYYFNRWGTEVEYKKYATPRLPVKGTIARGMVGDPAASLGIPANGSVPYYYHDNDDDRARASKEITTSPFPITESGLAQGKLLYNINCAICHGEKADGAGYLARDGSKYPVAPANFKQDTFYHSSNGRFYHAIMYGKNLMGSYADKLSYEERWQVIQYIRLLQAKDKKLQYDQNDNTFNSDIPSSKWTANTAGIDPIPMMAPSHAMPAKESNPKH